MSRGIEIKGLAELTKRFKEVPEKVKQQVEIATYLNAEECADNAKSNAPVDMGALRQGIRAQKLGKKVFRGYRVVANADGRSPYAPYVEFGTGRYVSVPPELARVASRFKGKSPGTFAEAFENIARWAKRKGIPRDAVYPIIMAILRNGTKPKPFIYPAFVRQRKQFINDVEKVVDREIGKLGK